jgi:hypothetical protein
MKNEKRKLRLWTLNNAIKVICAGGKVQTKKKPRA